MIKYIIKIITIFYFILKMIKYYNYYLELNKNYVNYQRELNITFPLKIKKKITIGIYTLCLKNGGRARITSILINLLNKIKIFNIYLFSLKNKEDNEYKIPLTIKRLVIKNQNLTKIFKYKIDIVICNLNGLNKISNLNKFKKIKVIYYMHNSIFHFIYSNINYFKHFYKEHIKSNYLISQIPIENDYIFKKWGINSILMNSFITYNYNLIFPSDLSSKTILMIGRANNKIKRFEIGIMSMEYIIQQIKDCELKIVSLIYGIYDLINLIENLNLGNKVKFIGFNEYPEIFFKNVSLHFFPTITESFGLALSETKIHGIPNILLGLDYISISHNGTIILYDDTPESLAKEAIKILINNMYNKFLSKQSKKDMIKYKNELLIQKWIKLILSIYNGNSYYKELRKRNIKLSEYNGYLILNKQIKMLQMRNKNFENININNFINFSFI